MFPLSKGSNRNDLTIQFSSLEARGTEHAAVRLHFMISRCATVQPLKMKSYKIHAPSGVDCASKCPLLENCGSGSDGPVVVHGRHLRAS